jgi:hypothetical protein
MTETTLPPPLVDSRVDLRDFDFMPLDVARLRDSSLAIEATGEEFRAAVLLWCAAWHQTPAASLPDNDQALSTYAGYGRTEVRAWRKVRTGALRGFVLCSDGRLYHVVLAEKANEAWEGRLRHRHKKECERIKKAAQRAETQPVYPTFDQWRAHMDATGSDRWEPVAGDVPAMSPGTDAGHGEGQTRDVPVGVPGVSPSLKGTVERDSGEGQGTGKVGNPQGSLRSPSSPAAPPTPPPPSGLGQQAKAERLAAVTADAMAAYNAIMAKPAGLLPAVTDVGIENKRKWVKRCIPVARDICARQHDAGQYPSDLISPQFWQDYFRACNADDFKSGRQPPGKGHENWTPDFEYLTRAEVMVEVFDRAVTEAAA